MMHMDLSHLSVVLFYKNSLMGTSSGPRTVVFIWQLWETESWTTTSRFPGVPFGQT